MATEARTVKIFRTDGSLIGEYPGADIREALQNAVKERANLRSANLRSADLRSADLRSADLGSANLRSANLRSADLRSANLRSADLGSADLRYANLGSPLALLLANWGALSPETTLALMRFDASAHPDPAAFDRWKEGGDCPYSGQKVERAILFSESRALWSPGPPPTVWEALAMILNEKCPGWNVKE